MSGEKIEQAKGTLKFVLNNLREGDLFNIVAYDSKVESFQPELQRFDSRSRQAALAFVEGIFAGGSTDINAALARAMNMLQDSSQPAYVIFLTDGLPTAGETREAAIVANCQKTNHVRARLFPFGVGYDVNSRLLDRLARANFGQSEYVRPDEDIEAAVGKLVARIKAPVMTDVTAGFDLETNSSPAISPVTRVYPKGSFDLFAGDQVVLVGRYRGDGTAKVTLQGAVAGNAKSFEFPAEFVKQSADDTNAFVAKLWATRRVGEIIDELDLNGHQEELITELVALATEHGILTPYTSFLADETSNIHDVAENRTRSSAAAQDLQRTSGREGVLQRFAKGQLQHATKAPSSGFGGGGLGDSGDALEEAQGKKLVANLGRGVVFYDHRQDKQIACTTICSLGRKTFFLRNGRWVDSSVTEKEEENAEKITRFSQEYFDLITRHGNQVAQYLVLDEPVICKLGGQTYEW
jgi:Ca-activated chloride channel family protein